LIDENRRHADVRRRAVRARTTPATLGGSSDQALAFFERSLTTQAAMLGLNDIFWLSAVILIAIVPLIWLTKPGKGAAASGH
jgi:hypothetical protein